MLIYLLSEHTHILDNPEFNTLSLLYEISAKFLVTIQPVFVQTRMRICKRKKSVISLEGKNITMDSLAFDYFLVTKNASFVEGCHSWAEIEIYMRRLVVQVWRPRPLGLGGLCPLKASFD
jgi:hypothetical protein